MVVNLPHKMNKDFKVIGSPMKFSETPIQYRHAPPELGEHTASVLSQYMTQSEFNHLKDHGIIG